MGKTHRIVWIGLLVLAGVGIGGLVATNPDQPRYEEYAVQTLSAHLETQLCQDIPAVVTQFLPGDCGDLITSNRSAIQDLIRSRTQRYNFWLFSLYTTTFAVPGIDLLPAYQVDSLGILNRFFTYRAVQR